VTTTDDVRTAAALGPAERALDEHVLRLAAALPALRAAVPRLTRWGGRLAQQLGAGARLLVAGNGGSAAEAQHLTAELVGRFDRERRPVSALALHAETSSVTAIGNDYGYAEVYARQVRAHARPGDVVLLLSTSGRSPNLLAAAHAAAECGAEAWALTGPGPNPLARRCAEAVCLPGDTSTVQESQLVAVHMVCTAFEEAFAAGDDREPPAAPWS
jgi:D-sedoheptulose 7-phosphate isomerase